MEKYKVIKKVGKCKPCTFYHAQLITNRQPIILKKMHRPTNWEEILQSKQLAIMKSSRLKVFPNVHEIVKDDLSFYIVMDFMEENLEGVIAQALDHDQITISFHQHSIVPKQLRPAYFFLSGGRNVLKLAHIETSKSKDLSKIDLQQMQDIKYLSPEEVLTSNEPDSKSNIFKIGLIVYQVITGKPLLNANTKINYIYEMCRLFPQQYSNLHHAKEQPSVVGDTFQSLMRRQEVSNELAALLAQMLKIDSNDRITTANLLDSYDLIAQNQIHFQKNKQRTQQESILFNKPNSTQADINNNILKDIVFSFQSKSTLSTAPIVKAQSKPIPMEVNIDDDAVQPIIIKQSSKPFNNAYSKQTPRQTRSTQNNPSFSTIGRPQLTNYAINEVNLGVQVGMNPTLFSDNDFDNNIVYDYAKPNI